MLDVDEALRLHSARLTLMDASPSAPPWAGSARAVNSPTHGGLVMLQSGQPLNQRLICRPSLGLGIRP